MPPTGASNQSYPDAMRKILGDVAQLGVLPDADLQFITSIQMAIAQNLRQGAAAQQQQAGGAPGPGQMGTPPPGGPPGNPPGAGGPPGMGGGAAGPMQGLAPNPDELRRMLGATGASQ